ncbi:hypothetical protein [uncultured Bosea sp.]|uniref:hypothetical protein n=1 Tax=uncultured Bosea sp. TaxID=211457 RepID=UPI00263B0B36|nr:hypothetical protein [uncultured Bosea sp.]
MAGFRHNPDTGEREYQDGPATDDAPAPSGPPMRDPGWVEMFLAPNEQGFPLRSPPRSPGPRHRGYRRKSLRR